MPDIAIVICTYNPNQNTFSRVLESVSRLQIPYDMSVECCIIDNNSSPSIQSLPFVQAFLRKCKWVRIIVEGKQGLSFARMAGVQATTAPVIIFFDDDNEPEASYLTELRNLLHAHPEVGVWGPGKIVVEFTQKVKAWVHAYKWLFQERENKRVEFGKEKYWTSYYPPGTGQIVKREVMLQYNKLVEDKCISMTDRKGNSLSSGGDAQIVYTAIRGGYAVGMAPSLIVTHLIDGTRTDIKYLKRLSFSIMSSGAVAHVEIFPEQKVFYNTFIQSSAGIVFRLIKIIGSGAKHWSSNKFHLDSAYYLGQLAGSYWVVSGRIPPWLSYLVKILKLQ